MTATIPVVRLDIGGALRSLRLDAGLHQQHVADAVGVVQPTVSVWERNEFLPSLEHLIAFEAFLDLAHGDVLRVAEQRPRIVVEETLDEHHRTGCYGDGSHALDVAIA